METKASSVFLLLSFALTAGSLVSLGSKVGEIFVSFGGYIKVRKTVVVGTLVTMESAYLGRHFVNVAIFSQ